jgi:hypothetical protein
VQIGLVDLALRHQSSSSTRRIGDSSSGRITIA